MKIIICGAGQVGWQIARHLAGEANDVSIVDNNAALVRRATDTLEVQGVVGFASHPDVLEQAGAREADMIIAATHSDEVNMVTCQVAHSVFNVTRKIARLRAQSYLEPRYTELFRRDHMPIDVVINPEREVSRAALRRLAAPSTFDIQDFLDGSVRMAGISLDADCPVLNTPLRQLTELFSSLRAIVVGVRRGGKLFAPEPGDQLFDGDQIYVVSESSDLARTLAIFGKPLAKQERIVIVGAGNVGLGVARALETQRDRVRVKVIERDRARAEVAADALERTIVLHGDGMDSELLTEAAIESADAVLAVTDDDKTNLLACVRAKAMGSKMTIALVNDPSLVPLMDHLGIDAHINPRATTVSSILRHVRLGRVSSIYTIGDGEAEVIEAQVLSTSPLAGRTIGAIGFPEGALVGAVKKNGEFVKPTGTTELQEGDQLVIFALRNDVPVIERLLQVAVEYF
ncbi:Trk system potassium transporter TrkA [Pararhodobacter zhoushanensis]|uniref:Trk system potassium uptake protein TrkA n=1 Tax=Pararhodobacter zhoushanensis TaxID=2479545 RepID=A0ABT3H073_9RHOB|nr:Trk system potassium transporter TrkA [Pararhodobacter zhoushanensis]MCW1933209.1 Trk system potassium transporter TrkA [Pararhodobacter zhoushanensis]